MRRSIAVVAALTVGCHASPSTQPAPAPSGAAVASAAPTAPVTQLAVAIPSDPAAVAAIKRAGADSAAHTAADMQYLADVIGPRLTGSAGLRKANDWTAQKFREYGMDSTWQEEWQFGRSWERGPMTLRMLEPHQRWLDGVSWAWSPGTNGPVAGDVMYVDAKTAADFTARFAGKLHGAWVMIAAPIALANPDAGKLSSADSARIAAERKALFAPPANEDERQFRSRRNAMIAAEGGAGLVRDGAKEFALLTMSGSPNAVMPLPQIVVSHEDYSQFYRLIGQGKRVRIEATISNTMSDAPVNVANTLAEIRGSEHPDEVVLLGAHLDSWDLGTGTTDNGTGSIAVLEAARILKASGVKPKRTIRFALFTGEEEGLIGSEKYAAAHASELPHFQAVAVLDNGTGRVVGMSLQGRDEMESMWRGLFAPASDLGPFTIKHRDKGGTDHLSFLPYGVPGFNYDQESRGYDHTHHSQVDTYDHAVIPDLQQAATVMALTAYELANLPSLLPRGPLKTAQ